MNAYEAIATRKTIRDFDTREVTSEVIERILGAGFCAPSNNHMREWHFVLLQDRAQRKALLDQVIRPVGEQDTVAIIDKWGLTDKSQRAMYIDAIPKQYRMLFTAGCLILPCFRQTAPILAPQTLSSLNGFASIWCCIENILVAAAAEGIYGVTRIPFEEERSIIKQFLNIPNDYEVPCYLALGYPGETAVQAEPVEINLSERIHTNQW